MGKTVFLGMALLLMGAGCAPSIQSYLRDLESEDHEDRMDAAVALGERGATNAVPALEDRLAKDEWPLVRATCARALARIGLEGSADAFVRALDDKNETVRWEAVLGLGKLGVKKETERIASLLASEKAPEVRRECAKILGLFGAVDRIPELIGALEDPDATVRLQAERSLQRLTLRDLGPHAEDWRAWHEAFSARMKGDGG
ncbi:MAG: HEAT repeat domain-containing protein [Planctomycetota bacterium]|jgi:HEAT repeat protein